MHVAELWRYPVKSAGERLSAAELRLDGIFGDRPRVALEAQALAAAP